MLSILFIYFNHYHDSKTLGFIYFVGLKNTPVAIGLCGPMSSSELTSPKQIQAQQSHTSKRHVATRKKPPPTVVPDKILGTNNNHLYRSRKNHLQRISNFREPFKRKQYSSGKHNVSLLNMYLILKKNGQKGGELWAQGQDVSELPPSYMVQEP